MLKTTETYSPQTFYVTAAVVAAAVVICLNSVLPIMHCALAIIGGHFLDVEKSEK